MRAWENWWVCESVWVCVRDIFVNAHTNGNNPKRPAARFHLWTSEVHKWSAFWTCILPESKTQLFKKSCVLDSAKRILFPTFLFMRVLGFKKSKQTHTKFNWRSTKLRKTLELLNTKFNDFMINYMFQLPKHAKVELVWTIFDWKCNCLIRLNRCPYERNNYSCTRIELNRIRHRKIIQKFPTYLVISTKCYHVWLSI